MYQGSHCSKYLQGQNVYIPANSSQALIEGNLSSAFKVITRSTDMTAGCAKYALPSICHSAYPLCRKDRTIPKPLLVCQEVCLSNSLIAFYVTYTIFFFLRTVNYWKMTFVVKSMQLPKNIIYLDVLLIYLIVLLYQKLIVLNLVLRNQKSMKVK